MPAQRLQDTGWQLSRTANPQRGYRPEYRVIVYTRRLSPDELAEETAGVATGGQEPGRAVTFRGEELAYWVTNKQHIALSDSPNAQVWFATWDSGD
jgi:hypothetical protein